jgi:hypothetical protein
MKKLILTTLLVVGSLSAYAGGHHFDHRGGWGSRSSISFQFGGYPYYSPWYSYSYPYYPSYSYGYYPGYGYDYSRPNYAVNGTLLGALTGGIIGNSIHHQGWEGAGIGAAAGLLLGGLAEHNARANEQSYYSAPAVSYAQPNSIANAPTVNNPPAVPDAPRVQSPPTYRPAGTMSSANSLFGR